MDTGLYFNIGVYGTISICIIIMYMFLQVKLTNFLGGL